MEQNQKWWLDFTLKEALFIGLCAMLIVLTKTVLRLNLKISGHAMFFTMFFLLLAKGCVGRKWTASTVSLLAALCLMLFAPGKAGPIGLVRFMLPGIFCDLSVRFCPFLLDGAISFAILAGGAAFARLPGSFLVDWFVGMPPDIALSHAFIKCIMGAAFGLIGGVAAWPVLKRLRTAGLAPQSLRAQTS
ncbi:hypothetical protein [Desulfobaculum bizertense]|uniref:Energy-coupling factor transport system substrate-specific component n=1 Tax=Desulfobaculum bizertense DSM 18034 TaxID=1121442 RepID=A0A1T4WCZ5_9BACT|nr:hypothetical protein [Desulfobaculum bizertense]UIJ37402.1 hypothetical protein LWC08_11845 [Desulfobaculum bizertense]SKA75067.1 hypothetical protein SAMN02745702_02090 [Desulfobaculum bizertense DSM 18034]